MIPKIKELSLHLVDVEKRSARHKSFEILSREEREDLWPGDLAKVILEIGKRLWIRVIYVMEVGSYFRSIVSFPLCSSDCYRGDMLVFKPENVAAIQRTRFPGFGCPSGRHEMGTKTLLQ